MLRGQQGLKERSAGRRGEKRGGRGGRRGESEAQLGPELSNYQPKEEVKGEAGYASDVHE